MGQERRVLPEPAIHGDELSQELQKMQLIVTRNLLPTEYSTLYDSVTVKLY